METITDFSKVAEVKISYSSKIKASERPTITGVSSAEEIFRSAWDEGLMEYQEHFKLMLLNTANKVLGVTTISTGGIGNCMVDAKIVFATALKTGASAIIVAHNHPSGNLQPSEADKILTNKLKQGGKLLDIPVLDHIILTSESYFSFGDKGLMY